MDVLPEEKDKAKDLAVWHQVHSLIQSSIQIHRVSGKKVRFLLEIQLKAILFSQKPCYVLETLSRGIMFADNFNIVIFAQKTKKMQNLSKNAINICPKLASALSN